MGEWKECKLGDLFSLEYGKSLKYYRYSEGKFPVYGTNGRIGNTDNYLSPIPSIIIGRKGAYRGVHFSSSPFFVIDTAFYVKPLTNNWDMGFMYNFLLTQDINGMDSGSAIPSTDRYEIYDIGILLPPLSEQKAIAGVLSSLDDKIDLLHRQNQTLEALAETLFRQWFIEEAKDEGKLGDFIKTTSGGTPSRKRMDFFENGTIQWVKSKELQGSFIFETEERITEEGLNSSSAKLLPPNTILIAMYGATVGEFGVIAKEATCNQAICALIPNENYPYTFIYYFIKSVKGELINMAVGSAQQNISQVLIRQLDIPLPCDQLLSFHKEVEPLFEKIKANTSQIRTIEKLRDTLLPKLMSGEVQVQN